MIPATGPNNSKAVVHAARLIFRVIGTDFKVAGKPTGQRFCEMLVRCCEGAW